MISPKKAAVRPRVILPEGDGESLLEDAISARLDAGDYGIIELVGASGTGKSTALAHLAHLLGAHPHVALADGPDEMDAAYLLNDAADRLVVCASPSRHLKVLPAVAKRWRLARWGDDDCIEYLLAKYPERCASVMRRLQADPQRKRLAGVPELWCAVLDQLAADDSVDGVASALRNEMSARLPSAVVRSAAGLWCFQASCHPQRAAVLADLLARWEDIDAPACSLLRHQLVQNLLAAEFLADELRLARNPKFLVQRFPEELVRATADLIRGDSAVILQLKRIVASRKRARHPMAASLLHAAGTGWKPAAGRAPTLTGAYLSGVHWPGIRLARVGLTGVDLTNSDLSEAQLFKVTASLAQLSGACLHGANLRSFSAIKATLAGADLSFVRAPQADFQRANLRQANFEGALLTGANFVDADLSECSFRRADLADAILTAVNLVDADLSGASLSRADLRGLELRLANFVGAQFANVFADECDLEYMRLPGANFERAVLRGALLTGSQMPDACFRFANLSEAGLADIEWERADLHGADLRGCTFHLGSSRSGLVGSPIASQGSRTGFYTDEYHEQEFKAPEEIRKANLCGADLRGAMIDDVDFYLVDLRGAQYTPEQEAQFRRCRAILETRV